MYLKTTLVLSSIFNLILLLANSKHMCCDGGEWYYSIIGLSVLIIVLSFIVLIKREWK